MAKHSPLGASSAERWIHCIGSVGLIQFLSLEETDDPDYRRDGTTAHAGAAYCLENGSDAWEITGSAFDGEEFTEEMAVAVQVYLDDVRDSLAADDVMLIEHQVIRPDLNLNYYGTLDTAQWTAPNPTHLRIRDYKHGRGIVVEVEDNPQLMYYAYGILNHPDLANLETIELGIVQPRAFHPSGPVRTWTISIEELREWAQFTLLPAMENSAHDETLDVGPWCRFCPAKLVCPAMAGLYGAVIKMDISKIPEMTDEALDRDYLSIQAVKFRIKALEERVLYRLLQGSTKFTNVKLVKKKADRVWKPGALDRFAPEFGDKAWSERRFLPPTQMEKLGDNAKELVKEWAFTPDTGYTVALATDKRTTIAVKKASETFAQALKKLENSGEQE